MKKVNCGILSVVIAWVVSIIAGSVIAIKAVIDFCNTIDAGQFCASSIGRLIVLLFLAIACTIVIRLVSTIIVTTITTKALADIDEDLFN